MTALQYILGGKRQRIAVEFALETTIAMLIARRLIRTKGKTAADIAKNGLLLSALNFGEETDDDNLLFRITKEDRLEHWTDDETWTDWLEEWFDTSVEVPESQL